MTAKKKVSRKELKQPDEFISLWNRAFEFLTQHKREAFWILGGLFALAVVVLAWRTYSQSREQKAMALLGEAQRLLGSLSWEENQEQAADQDPEKALDVLRRLEEEYRGSRAAQLGRILLGNAYYQKGEVDRAVETFNEFLDRGHVVPELRGQVCEGLGYCYEAMGQYEKAAEYYQKASEITPSYSPGWALFGLARCHEKLGNYGRAAEDYRKLLADYPQHPQAEEARAGIDRIKQLEASQGAAAPAGQSDSGVKKNPADASAPAP